jgi:hypothetical protein
MTACSAARPTPPAAGAGAPEVEAPAAEPMRSCCRKAAYSEASAASLESCRGGRAGGGVLWAY